MVLYYSAVKKISRRVGMADEADSKSVVGNHVWVQVPSPAVINLDFTRCSEVSNQKVIKKVINKSKNTGKESPVQVLLKINRP